jgi:Tetratricopeptide Repeats-Sensor
VTTDLTPYANGEQARLEMLIATYGESSERLGLLGGRYKQLASDAADDAERHRYVDRAISSYERGSVDGHGDDKVRGQLSGVLTALEALLPPVSPAEPDDRDPRP